ncbi:MAG: hypothetical protein LBQ97_07090 [Fusobacteriaceae bacterium]|jgi:hypothetical protein|nr:hypothetical protein [Fusobacteriaceae bacterium]
MGKNDNQPSTGERLATVTEELEKSERLIVGSIQTWVKESQLASEKYANAVEKLIQRIYSESQSTSEKMDKLIADIVLANHTAEKLRNDAQNTAAILSASCTTVSNFVEVVKDVQSQNRNSIRQQDENIKLLLQLVKDNHKAIINGVTTITSDIDNIGLQQNEIAEKQDKAWNTIVVDFPKVYHADMRKLKTKYAVMLVLVVVNLFISILVAFMYIKGVLL